MLLFLFFDVFQCHFYSSDYKGRKSAFFPLDGRFNCINHVIRKTDSFVRGWRNGRNFKFTHNRTSQYICLAYSVLQNKAKICIAFAMHI